MNMEIPKEYKRGYTTFLDCHIDLSKRPLIPRVETEEWVRAVVASVVIPAKAGIHGSWIPGQARDDTGSGDGTKVLDIFAGSGCIGIAMLKHLPNATVDFVDSEDNCIEQIKINCDLNKINPKRYRIIKSDVFNNLPDSSPTAQNDTKYDLILANPPYCVEPNVDISVLTYEPIKAVIGGGEDGLNFVKKFLATASKYLRPNGEIYMEFDGFQKEKIDDLLSELNYHQWEFHKDQFGRWRWVSFS